MVEFKLDDMVNDLTDLSVNYQLISTKIYNHYFSVTIMIIVMW